MSEEHKRINYDLAKAEADKVDEQIIAALQNGNSFRVEAGAGSGKTYSLNKAIEWIQTNKWAEYSRKKQTVVWVNPKFCVNSISGANRAKFICGGSRLVRLPPCQQHNAGGGGCQGRRSRLFYP